MRGQQRLWWAGGFGVRMLVPGGPGRWCLEVAMEYVELWVLAETPGGMRWAARRAGAPRGGGGLCLQRRRCSLRPPGLAGHLAGLLAAAPACADAYRGLSDCVLKLGDSMATYEEEEGIELQGLRRVCRYWDEFHTCALTVLWECQKEAAAVWEMLRRESRKTKFQGSLFDLCSPSMAQSSAWIRVPNISILSIPLIVTWLNL
ncbi:PREDICTED: neuritin [Corvus brachyrhynchos]|uniref:neuritin n=1 Tax=Corvus brachyrhynchos TaxID=85066 RepID=UPI0008166A97|nr:PREDICTED: neuritin [Corvus brachyrhynchos]